jgi:EAL domain-containing protein (putative c-di-GMP-specific phosphodiesterase class I)
MRRSPTPLVGQAAIRQCAAWRQAGHKLSVAVNLSARNLLDPQLPSRISASLRNHGVQSDWFAVEITETAIMIDTMRAARSFFPSSVRPLDRRSPLSVRSYSR